MGAYDKSFICMKIETIEKITAEEQKELDKLNTEAKQRGLNGDEASRQLFLEVKEFWNCEC